MKNKFPFVFLSLNLLLLINITAVLLLGVPLAATIYKLCFEKLERREKALGITSTKTETPAQKTPEKSKIPVSKSQKKK